MSQNVLIIGASGRLGLALIRVASQHRTRPQIHAFLRNPSKLPEKEASLCTSIQKGDALSASSISLSLKQTRADTVIITIGVPDSTAPSTLRTDSAKAVVEAVQTDEFAHVRVVCISSIGAGGSEIISGFGIGRLVQWRLRHLLKDHDLQEETLWKGFEREKVLVVRPAGLLDGKAKGRVVTFGDHEQCPSVSIDREEVAGFVVRQVCDDGLLFGKTVNIASVAEENGQWGIKALLTLV